MKIVANIVTIIATLIYSITTYLLMYDPIGRSTRSGIHLFNFFIWYTIPIILWIIYYVKKERVKRNSQNINNFKHLSTSTNHLYYIQEKGSTSKPLTYNQLSEKKININTFVWRKGIDWTKAGDLRELSELFEQNGPPPFDKNKLVYDTNDNFAQIIGIILLIALGIAIFMNVKC